MSRPFAAVLLSLTLVACTLSSAIDYSALDYNDAIEDVVDKLLVINILRARDNAPLHFGDIPSIHESLQVSGSLQSAVPYGPLNHNTSAAGRATVTPTVGAQISPSFDLNNLDAKDFVTGLMAPIDPYVVKYWLDRGLDKRLVLLLFFAAAEITTEDQPGHKVSLLIHNAPRIAPKDDENSEFSNYLTLINRIVREDFTANSYSEVRQISGPFTMDPGKSLKGILGLDPAKFEISYATGTKQYALFSATADKKVAFCIGHARIPLHTDTTITPQIIGDSCTDPKVYTSTPTLHVPPEMTLDVPPEKEPPVDVQKNGKPHSPQKNPNYSCPGTPKEWLDRAHHSNPDKDRTGCPVSHLGVKLYIRSVGDIIHFLGDLLNLREHPLPNINYPVTLDFCYGKQPSTVECNHGYLFRLIGANDPSARFAVNYRGASYAVGPDDPSDHTLQVLAILNQLVNLNKSATDLRTTPFVQVLP